MMRFVIVDDDKAAANALAKKLAAYDETELCGIALNGLDGLRMINETRPDVLFLDIELPDISGIEFLEHVNCLPQYKCRTVMYTAHDRFMLSAFRNKAFDYLMKPIDDTELRNIVRRVCIEMAGAREPETHHQHRLSYGGDEQHLPLLSAVRQGGGREGRTPVPQETHRPVL